MEIAQIVLEYLKVVFDLFKVLVWPLVVLFVLYHYREHLSGFLGRINKESEEISLFNQTIHVKFSKLQELVAKLPVTNEESKEIKEKARELQREFAIQQIRELAPQFFSMPSSTWLSISEKIEDLSSSLELSDILHFANSKQRGEHVAAGIALKQRIQKTPGTDMNQEVIDIIKHGIKDEYSRVQVRFIEAIGASNELSRYFKNVLVELVKEDDSQGVRDAARRILDAENA